MKDQDNSPASHAKKNSQTDENLDKIDNMINKKQNPVKIIIKRIIDTESNQIMQEAAKAMKYLSKMDEVIDSLQADNELM
jgi:hypothetical protein